MQDPLDSSEGEDVEILHDAIRQETGNTIWYALRNLGRRRLDDSSVRHS